MEQSDTELDKNVWLMHRWHQDVFSFLFRRLADFKTNISHKFIEKYVFLIIVSGKKTFTLHYAVKFYSEY